MDDQYSASNKEVAVSSSSLPEETAESKELERRYVRKLDWNLLPLLMLLQIASFLDRSNIGNAKINGLVTDLHLVGQEFNGELEPGNSERYEKSVGPEMLIRNVPVLSVAASLFYVTYIVFEIPFNIIQQRIGASRMGKSLESLLISQCPI